MKEHTSISGGAVRRISTCEDTLYVHSARVSCRIDQTGTFATITSDDVIKKEET